MTDTTERAKVTPEENSKIDAIITIVGQVCAQLECTPALGIIALLELIAHVNVRVCDGDKEKYGRATELCIGEFRKISEGVYDKALLSHRQMQVLAALHPEGAEGLAKALEANSGVQVIMVNSEDKASAYAPDKSKMH